VGQLTIKASVVSDRHLRMMP